MTTNEIFSQVKSHLAIQSDEQLVEMLKVSNDQAVTMWIATEIEQRHPEITPALEAWADDLDSEMTQVEAILAALS